MALDQLATCTDAAESSSQTLATIASIIFSLYTAVSVALAATAIYRTSDRSPASFSPPRKVSGAPTAFGAAAVVGAVMPLLSLAREAPTRPTASPR